MTDSSFTGNYASAGEGGTALGGAIYSGGVAGYTYTYVPEEGTVPEAVSSVLGEGKEEWSVTGYGNIQINAKQKDVVFTGNKTVVNGVETPNDIYIDGSAVQSTKANGLIFKVIADDDLLEKYKGTMSTSRLNTFNRYVELYKKGEDGKVGSSTYSLSEIVSGLKSSYDNSVYSFLQDEGLAEEVMGRYEDDIRDLMLNASSDRTISFDGGIEGQMYSVNMEGSGTVRLQDSYLRGAEKVSVKRGTFDITTSEVEAKEVEFASGTTFGVTLNEDDTSGTITANKISIGDNVNAQVLVSFDAAHSGQKEYEVLTATESLTGTFADTQINNNLFDISYESKENAGIFKIEWKEAKPEEPEEPEKPEPTPKPQSEKEYAEVEAAWFGANEYEEGSRAKEIVDDLFILAQKDDASFRGKLAEIAPSKAPVKMDMTSIGVRRLGRLTRNALNGGLSSSSEGLSSGDGLQANGIWIQSGFGYYNYSGNGAYKGHEKYIVAGADRDVSKNLKLGAGLGYVENNLKEQARDTRIKGYELFGYGRYELTERARVDGVVAYMGSRYEEEGQSGLNGAEYNTDALGAEVKGTYDVMKRADYGTLGISGGSRYILLHERGYKDQVEQEVKSENSNLWTLTAGISYENGYKLGMYEIRPKVSVTGTYDIVKERTHGRTRVANGQWYVLQNGEQSRWGSEVEASVGLISGEGKSLTVSYEGAFKKHYENHTISLKGKVEF